MRSKEKNTSKTPSKTKKMCLIRKTQFCITTFHSIEIAIVHTIFTITTWNINLSCVCEYITKYFDIIKTCDWPFQRMTTWIVDSLHWSYNSTHIRLLRVIRSIILCAIFGFQQISFSSREPWLNAFYSRKNSDV